MARSSTFDAIIRLKDQASQQLSKIEANLVNHEKAWKRTGKSLQRYGDSVQGLGKNMTAGLTAPIVAAGAASFAMAAEYQDALGAVEQIYKDSSGAIKKWSDELPSYYGIAKDEALGYASTMGAMLKNIGGLTDAEASKQSATLIELAGDLSAMFGGSTESAVQALTGALKGNNAMLDNYGMGVNEATIKTKALEMGLESAGGQLSLADKQAATLALIMEQTADAQGQAAREADGASGSIKALKTEMRNLAIAIGEAVIPVVLPLIEKLKGLMEKFKGLDDSTKNTIVKVGMFVAAIGPLLLIFGAVVKSVGSAFIILSKLSGVMVGLGKVIGVIGAIASSPFLPVIAILGVLIGTTVLVASNWDMLKAKAIEIGTAISIAWSSMVQRWKDGFEQAKENIANAMENLKERLYTALQGIKENVMEVAMTAIATWTAFTTALHEKFEIAKEGLINAVIKLKDAWINAFYNMKSAITDALLSPLKRAMDLAKTFSQTKIGQKVMTGVGGFVQRIGSNADGTSHWRGGLTTIHEKGGEIIDLKRGARVYPHDKSIQMAYADGQKSAGSGAISVNFDGAIFHVREEADVNRIGKTVAERLRFAAMNRGGAVI